MPSYDPQSVAERALTTNADVLRTSLDVAVVIVSWLNQRQLIPTEVRQQAWTALRPVVEEAVADGWTDTDLAAAAVEFLADLGYLTGRSAA